MPQVTQLTPTNLTHYLANPYPISLEQLPPLRPVKFEYKANQPFRHFWYLYSHSLPQQHAWIHSHFCRDPYCPFHS